MISYLDSRVPTAESKVYTERQERSIAGGSMHIRRNAPFTDTDNVDYSATRRRDTDTQRSSGGNMPASYYVIGVVGLLAILVAVKLTPDLIRT